MINRRNVFAGLALCLSCIGATAAAAQTDWPTKPVTIIAPYAPGNSSDFISRLIAEELAKKLDKPFLVENRPGAGGVIGTKVVAEAPADGYTILLASIFTNSIADGMKEKPPYDSLADFTYIAGLTATPLVLITSPAFPAKTLQEFVDYSRSHPGEVTVAVITGGSTHLAIEDLKARAQLDIRTVPYAGGSPGLTDVLGNQVNAMFLGVDVVRPYVEAGQLIALGVASQERAAVLPDAPTFAEGGFADFNIVFWTGLAVPDGTPQPVVDKLSASVAEILEDPAVRTRFENSGAVLAPSTPAAFTAFVRSEVERWSKVLKDAKLGGH